MLYFADFKQFCEVKENIFRLLLDNNILNIEERLCFNCGIGFLQLKSKKQTTLGKVLRCNHFQCRHEINLLNLTRFKNVHLRKMIYLLGCFLKNKSIASIIDDNSFDEKTIFKYFKMFRICCSDKMINTEIRLGGVDVEVEIDETHLFTRKYNRGELLSSQQIWIFGIMERISKRVYLQVVESRDGQTLFEIVNRILLPGTKIFSDSWRGYNLIKENFDTLSVNHRICFVDRDNRSIHTNNIERLWRSLKEDLRGVSNENYSLHLNEFCFRRYFLTGNFLTDLGFFIRLLFN